MRCQRHAPAGTALAPFLFQPTETAVSKGASALAELVQLIPENGPQNSQGYVVSPTDLLPVTNAIDVFALNYLRADQRRVGALFATSTQGEIYEHTKVVCDRLRGAVLEHLDLVTVAGQPFVRSGLRHADGSFDHAISFVVYPEGDGYVVDSRFRQDEYDAPVADADIFNLQVWSVSKMATVELAEQVLARLAALGPVRYRNTDANPPALPKTYVRTGRYEQGRLTLELYNAAGASRVHLTGGTLARTESGLRTDFVDTIELPEMADDTPVVEVELNLGPIFDAAFFVEVDGEDHPDQLYLADGAWSFAYDTDGASVDRFAVDPEAPLTAEPGKWTVERPATLAGRVETWTALFRYLQSNALPVDLTDYQYVEFTAWGEGQVRMLLEKASITTSDHYGHIFHLDDEPQRVRVWFDDLARGDGRDDFVANDVAVLSFYVYGDQHRDRPFTLNVSGVTFGGGPGDILADLPDRFELAQNYPNPFNPETTLAFSLPEATEVQLTVYDALGREVAVLANGRLDAGRHTVRFDAGHLASGVYLYRLNAGGKQMTKSMVLLR